MSIHVQVAPRFAVRTWISSSLPSTKFDPGHGIAWEGSTILDPGHSQIIMILTVYNIVLFCNHICLTLYNYSRLDSLTSFHLR